MAASSDTSKDHSFKFFGRNNVNNNLPESPKKTNTNKSKISKEDKSKALRGKGKPEIIPRSRKPSLPNRHVVQKSQRENEEEIRKKMEGMMIECQRRIAERTASSGARAAPRKDQTEVKTTRISPKSDKNKTQSVKDINRISSVKVRGI